MRLIVLAAGLMGLAAAPAPVAAEEIPAFARRYGVSCSLCHTALPRLSAFGEQFAGNGFRMAPTEPPRDTVGTGDDLLTVARQLPLALRLDAYVNAYAYASDESGRTSSDLQTPYNLKILSGGAISEKLSYYLYFVLAERGEVAGIEDAFVYLNDLGGLPLDIAVGQFQISDPMFKRELRLEYQDYAVYRARVGAQPADLTYDRGIMAIADVAGFTLTAELLNGNGKGAAGENRRLDDDPWKTLFGHVSRDILPNLRIGAMGYWGRAERGDTAGAVVTNDLWMVGADATITAGPAELNVQYVHRRDDTPTFTLGEATSRVSGGLAELILHPVGSRWYGVALYNRVVANREILTVRLGERPDHRRYESISAGVGYLWRRNFRVFGEATWDDPAEEIRLTLGLTTAF
jgi:hypothetical protein